MIMTENRFIVMKRNQTLYLLFISGFCSFTLGSSDFHLITLLKTYNEAKTYCRETYTDLATVHNQTDMNNLVTLVSKNVTRAWIGLETGDVWMWHWSWPDQKLDFLNWKAGEPQNNNQDACAAMDQESKWFESDCGTKRSFVCHGNNSGHIFVAETKSWRDAQNHCRDLLSDLASIRSAEDNEAVQNVSLSQNVWIGLFKDPWKWSDGSNTSFRWWKPLQPNYLVGQNCAAVIFKDDGKWNDLRCDRQRSFVCHGARKPITTTPGQTSTQDTLTTDQLLTNLTTLPNTSPQEVITTFNFTVVAFTNHSSTTNVTTNETTTASELITPNATDVELNNTTAEMSNVTETQLPSTTVQNATQSENRNLVLIQENMTWIEAMNYCREHHIDLVHITNKDIQEKVAEKAKNATSLHVWLGLRYTCTFDFWFWTSSTTGCYLNWAPGQGFERKYECGVTGAVEATGRQQWVGLPETEKLNFICYACAG